MYSYNGTNFVGANKELKEAYQSLLSNDNIDQISKQSLTPIDWQFSPSGAPHFGGLWEAGVRAMNSLLKKSVGTYFLSFEELTTIVAATEAVLNSRPFTSANSLPIDGVVIITPGYFLIGRPLQDPPPKKELADRPSLLRRWKLINHFTQDLWSRWCKTYLQNLQARHKWVRSTPCLQVGDMVLLKDSSFQTQQWPMAKVVRTLPGDDGLVRVVELR